MPRVLFSELGRFGYQEAWDLQERLFQELVDRKLRNRNLRQEEQEPLHHYLLFCEHPHVFTLGRSGDAGHLLADDQTLNEIGATFIKNNRGGDITYHGPGQLVGYPILDLDDFFTDIHRYLRYLEEAIIRVLGSYGVKAGRYPGYTGVWIDPEDDAKARKICAMGVRCSRWVTMHGFAFNVNTDLSYFEHIVPCGIKDKDVTSLQRELGRAIDMSEVSYRLKHELAALFGMQLEQAELG
ncbi:MAG TPA: lipoyl(octanoyl) transferase LipB [Bacteroidia bacterium]|nr:lipoyl(octanoyl) transferase LipB [Bacteroidia bacterium]